MLNRIIIMGRLTKNPELRKTQAGISVCGFTVAVDRDYGGHEKETDFFDCSAWRGTAEFAANYLAKGKQVVVEGKMQSRKWQDKDGNSRISWEVQVDSIYFAEKKEKKDSIEDVGKRFDDYDDGEPPF